MKEKLTIKNKAYIFDIDGVLSDPTHRMDLYEFVRDAENNEQRSWAVDNFVSECPKDEPFKDVINLCKELWSAGIYIIFLTGRSSKFRSETEQWILKQIGLPTNHYKLLMKPQGNFINSKDFKQKVYEQEISKDFNIIGVFEDRVEIVKMWRELGLTCFALPSIFD